MNFIGFVEHVNNTRITGWVRSLDDEAMRPVVLATLDDIDVGSARADDARPDLAERGIGQGDHGFDIAITIAIKPEDAEAVEVQVIGPDGERHLLALLASREEQDKIIRPAPAAPPVPPAPVNDLLAGRTSDPGSEIDPFADLDLTREARPAAAPPAPEATAPSAGIGAANVGELKIFVLGAARSGTSALFTALSTVFGLPGYGESHVIPAFQRMIHQLRQYVEIFDSNPEDIMIKHMGAAPVEALLFGYVRELYRDTYKGSGFVDKTPTGEAIYGAPLIESIFPEAYLVATRRNGIEVVQSFRLKFSTDFADACLAWSEAMSGILHARARCQNLIEIDQFDMANQPERTGRRIAAWLGFPEHGAALGQFFARERIEKSSTHDWSRRLTLADVDWTPAEKATFTRICGRMMEQFEYTM